MKLLFDENLSPKLSLILSDVYPGSESALRIGLGGKSDGAIWQYAIDNEMLVVSKDSDFIERAMLSSSGPKFIWLRLGNCTTQTAAQALRFVHALIQAFNASEDRVIEFS